MIKFIPSITPHYYQSAAKAAFYARLKADKLARPIIEMETGSGKSIVLVDISIDAVNWSKRVLHLTHSETLVDQNSKALIECTDGHIDLSICCAGIKSYDLSGQVVFASIQTLANRLADMRAFDLVIIDECFSGETLISTPSGHKKINEVSSGDIVYNAVGTGVVSSTSVKQCDTIYKVRLSNGKEIKTTNNHPIFTEHGWTRVEKLEKRNCVFSIQDMRRMRKKNNSNSTKRKDCSKINVSYNPFLLNFLLEKERECYVGGWRKRKNERDIKKNWSQTNNPWRQWKRINRATKTHGRNFRNGVGNRATNKNECGASEWCLSELLQGRYWKQGFENSYRDGWGIAQWKKKIARPEKRQFSKIARVESIEIEKSGSTTPMYNLQVSGHPSYFAGGILVHNCHLISVYDDTQYQKVFADLMQKNPNTRFLGLTATPYRLKQGWLYWAVVKRGEDKPTPPFFTDICYKTDTNQLIKDGYLAEPVTRAIAVSVDLKGVTVAANGDYKQAEEGAATAKIIPSAIKEIIATNAECKRGKTIIFASTIENAELVVHELHCYGIKCALVVSKNYDDFEEIDEHGKPLTDKKESLSWFSEPIDYDNPRYLVNVGMFVAGVNVRDIDHVVLLYATMSNSKLKQTVGRGFRAATGKKDFIVSDYGTNFSRLGTIDNPIIKASGNGECPTKQCQAVINVINSVEIACNAYNQLTAKKCCECGTEFYIVGGNDKYTPLAEAAPLLTSQQEIIEYYAPVESFSFAEHTSNNGNKSLKLTFWAENNELIASHYFSIRSDKTGWKNHNLELLKGFFYDEQDFYKNKKLFENGDLFEVAQVLNASYEMACKPIKGVKYKQDGRFKRITDIELEEIEND